MSLSDAMNDVNPPQFDPVEVTTKDIAVSVWSAGVSPSLSPSAQPLLPAVQQSLLVRRNLHPASLENRFGCSRNQARNRSTKFVRVDRLDEVCLRASVWVLAYFFKIPLSRSESRESARKAGGKTWRCYSGARALITFKLPQRPKYFMSQL